eukprot:TRINITY_DN4027_c0_g1_i1.p1 TRINITY_DN4027_c0_g1~~TRINITY_DN4027_c0_g1_i1.p1  ORF type:complete len:173 (+),score=53.25 TRINITY_DN4027_c0_g1_i1:39-521(+)
MLFRKPLLSIPLSNNHIQYTHTRKQSIYKKQMRYTQDRVQSLEFDVSDFDIETNDGYSSAVKDIDQVRKEAPATHTARIQALKDLLKEMDHDIYQAKRELEEEKKARKYGWSSIDKQKIEDEVKARKQLLKKRYERSRFVRSQGRTIKIARQTRAERSGE